MKIIRPLFPIALLSLLIVPVALGQDDKNDLAAYSENYRFSLRHTSAENQQHSLEFVVSAKTFKASTFEPRMDFSGVILAVEKGSLVLQYDLRLQKPVITEMYRSAENGAPFQTLQTVQIGLTSNIRLRLGEAVEIWKADQESTRLTVTRVK